MSVIWCLIYINLLTVVENYEVIYLNKFDWKVRNENRSIEVSARVPGGIFTDLRRVNILNNSIYYRFNDVNYRWVSRESWTYFVTFSINENIRKRQNIELVFHGLDGIANISLNDKPLGKAANTFVRYRFNIAGKLLSENNLEIIFESPIDSANRSSKDASHQVPPSCVPKDYNGECHVNFLRRMQASFGWDWGLAMPSVGIWKSVEFSIYDHDLKIQDITVTTVSAKDRWKVIVRINSTGPLDATSDITGQINVTIFLKDNSNVTSSNVVSLPENSPARYLVTTLIIFVPKASVKLWWPNGYGSQNLYNLTASFTNGVHENKKSIMIGFRTVEVIQEPVNKTNLDHGLTFYFAINDVAIFAKGSNYIVNNILLENTCDKRTIRNLLQAAKECNMNILRIWGGGIYECDYLYELSDQYGILIWQDMMFACNMYPVDNQFLASVTEEITQQIWRLQHHVSIVNWAGNNENEAALSGNWYGTRSNYPLFKKEYVHLYVDVVKEAVLAVDNSRYFLTSSPSNGLKSESEGYVSTHPYDPLYGDVHFYDYYHDPWLIDNYPMTRFGSEYGYQSLPSLSTLKKVATPQDLNSLNSPFMQHRQHLPFGQLFLVYLMFFHFAAPPLHDIENLIYVSQINQACAVKSQTEWYRKWRGILLPNGQGRTMGAMYWQLNDVWQAPTWSSIECGGKWKMLQYYAKKFFQPVIVTGDLDRDGNITINVISDEVNDIQNAEILLNLYRWDSMNPVESISYKMTIPKESSQTILETNVEKLIESHSACKSVLEPYGSKCFMKLSLRKERILIHENFLYPKSFKRIDNLQNCTIQVRVTSCEMKDCKIYLKTDSICLFIWMDTGDIPGHFSDNGFTMTEPVNTVHFFPKQEITSDQLQKSLNIMWLDKGKLDGFTFSADIMSIFKLVYGSTPDFLGL